MIVLTTAALVSAQIFAGQTPAPGEGASYDEFSWEDVDTVPAGGEVDLPLNTRLFQIGWKGINGATVTAGGAAAAPIGDWQRAWTDGAPLGLMAAGDVEVQLRSDETDDLSTVTFSVTDAIDDTSPVPGGPLEVQSSSMRCGLFCTQAQVTVGVTFRPASDDSVVVKYDAMMMDPRGQVLSETTVDSFLTANAAIDVELLGRLSDLEDGEVDVAIIAYDIAGNTSAYEQLTVLLPPPTRGCACQRPSGTPASFFGLALGALVFGLRRRRVA